jgi:hypothetical protein
LFVDVIKMCDTILSSRRKWAVHASDGDDESSSMDDEVNWTETSFALSMLLFEMKGMIAARSLSLPDRLACVQIRGPLCVSFPIRSIFAHFKYQASNSVFHGICG